MFDLVCQRMGCLSIMQNVQLFFSQIGQNHLPDRWEIQEIMVFFLRTRSTLQSDCFTLWSMSSSTSMFHVCLSLNIFRKQKNIVVDVTDILIGMRSEQPTVSNKGGTLLSLGPRSLFESYSEKVEPTEERKKPALLSCRTKVVKVIHQQLCLIFRD